MVTTRTDLVTSPDLPSEFVRINWISEQAKAKWEPIFAACSAMFTALEKEAVRGGIRRATIQSINPAVIDTFAHDWMQNDYMVIPIEKVQSTGSYQSSGGPCDISKPWMYKVAIGKFEDVRELVYAYREGNTYKIGDILGYPDCCIEFFEQHWVKEHWLDTSLPMALGESSITTWNPLCNILLRWLGLRFVSHLPCSFNCVDTAQVGRSYMQLAYDLGHRTTADALYDILSWPVEWTGLHGIGILTTPVCRITFRTDMLDKKHTVRLHSDKRPEMQISGLEFPLHKIRKPNANGFYSKDAERISHNLILDILRYSEKLELVIDLGCGDSLLLHKIADEFACRTVGVDHDVNKRPDIIADIFDADYLKDDYSCALISKARIRENPDGWKFLLNMLTECCAKIVIYSYDGDIRDVPIGPYHVITGIRDGLTSATLYALTKP